MYNSVACESAPNSSQAKNISKGSGCKSCYSLMLLEDHDRMKQAFPDVMHAMKNIVVAFIDLITGREDTVKVRRTEEELKRFPGCYIKEGAATTSVQGRGSSTVTGKKNKMSNAKKNLPDAPFHLTKDELKKADQRSSEICVPSGFGWRPATFFSNYLGMKTHDWKEVVSLHILRHIVDGIECYGPTHSWSMWSYERFNSWISRRVMNRTSPEATILRTYQRNTSEDDAKAAEKSTTTIPQNVFILLKDLNSANIDINEECCNLPNVSNDMSLYTDLPTLWHENE
ncbi:Hypothetical predicted protein [Paramuricea clavata]|uniref:Uncharacterized protein n=1 Tax=Paramuricea clavata TaxID=317549 RepID=A0A6S7G0G3_PARCT|nr:Hypothetical predicted protein [Paramuricea clavata]